MVLPLPHLFSALPMNAIIIAMGAFASQGYLNGPLALSLTVLTNVLADSFGFFLTYHYGQVIIDKLIPKWDGKLLVSREYLRKYAFGTSFLTRIAGPFIPYVDFLSGLIGVPYLKFLIADFLGNAIGAIFFLVQDMFLAIIGRRFSMISGWSPPSLPSCLSSMWHTKPSAKKKG